MITFGDFVIFYNPAILLVFIIESTVRNSVTSLFLYLKGLIESLKLSLSLLKLEPLSLVSFHLVSLTSKAGE